jgi:hypothetical protein
MPVYRPIGDRLVRKEEIAEIASVEGKAVGDVMGQPLGISGGEPRPFKAVGPGKPLLVEIRYVYTGKYPDKRLGFISPNCMLVTSAVRSIATYNASPKAINFLKENVEPKFNMSNPAAGENGTPIVFYVPALTEANSVLDIEIVFDRFDSGLVRSIGSAFTSAGQAGIPLFGAHSSWLLAAGLVTRLGAEIGERLLDGKPSFSQTEELSFLRGGVGEPSEGFHILTEEDFDPSREGCVFDNEIGRLINEEEQREYEGQYPYVVISLNGEKREEYDSFVPTAASAALLERFYHIKDGQVVPTDMLLEAVKLYSDLQYKRKADDAESQQKNLDPNSEDYAEDYEKLEEKKKAYLANLITGVFK